MNKRSITVYADDLKDAKIQGVVPPAIARSTLSQSSTDRVQIAMRAYGKISEDGTISDLSPLSFDLVSEHS